MNKLELTNLTGKIGNYITDQFSENHASMVEGLTIMSTVTLGIIESLCDALDEDFEQMVGNFCNALQHELKKQRIYTTGKDETDIMLDNIINEINAGGNVEEIVDKYIDCKTPEIRQQVIDGINEMIENHSLDNVKIGYK